MWSVRMRKEDDALIALIDEALAGKQFDRTAPAMDGAQLRALGKLDLLKLIREQEAEINQLLEEKENLLLAWRSGRA